MPRLYLYAALLLLTQCSKCKDDPEPLTELPRTTQDGKNTMGCLVNGRAWTPKGNNGTANFHAHYDPTFDGGTLQVSAYRYPKRGGQLQDVNLLCTNVSGPGSYPITLGGDVDATFYDDARQQACKRYGGPTLTYRRGQLTVTRLDLQAGIVAGTFAYTLGKPGCDSVRITDGRFDYKLF
jgi:hypothetical protein